MIKRLPLHGVAVQQFLTLGLFANVIVELVHLRVRSNVFVQALLHKSIVLLECALAQAAAHVTEEGVAHRRHFHTCQRH